MKKGFDNRNLVKTSQGPKWLTVPVESSGHFSKLCSEVRIVNNGWARKHVKTIDLAYRRAPYYNAYMEQIADLLAGRKYDLLADLNGAILEFGLDSFELSPVLHKAQEYAFVGTKSELILDMCRTLGANEYIFGGEGKGYADTNAFRVSGVKPHFLTYEHPTYSQLHGDFVPNMSFIDLLFNVGPESKYILTAAGHPQQTSQAGCHSGYRESNVI